MLCRWVAFGQSPARTTSSSSFSIHQSAFGISSAFCPLPSALCFATLLPCNTYTPAATRWMRFRKGLLAEQGIDAIVQGAALQETWGGLNLTAESLPSVWVG